MNTELPKKNVAKKETDAAPKEENALLAQALAEKALRAEEERRIAEERASGVGPAATPDGISKLGKPALRATLEALASRLERAVIESATPNEEAMGIARELRKLSNN